MAKNSITDYSKTAASNTDIQSVDIAEGCLPSGINNAIREIMADLADMNDGTVSLTSPAFTSVDINGGTIDGTTIGGTTPAAGTFTTGQFNTSLNVDGTVTADGLTVEGASNPVITLSSTNTTVADGDLLGGLIFQNSDSSGSPPHKFGIIAKADDAFGDGSLFFYTNRDGLEASETPAVYIGGKGADENFVGIGTSSPSKQLHQIRTGSASDLPTLSIETGFITQSTNVAASSQNISIISGNAGEGRLFFGDTDDEDAGNIVYSHANNSMSFDTAGSERMRIDSSGRVGIGTSSLSNGVKTVIQGSQTGGAAATSGTTQTYGLLRLQGTTFTSALDMGTNGGNYAWIQSTDQTNLGTNYSLVINPNGGNVGIGATSPNARLDVVGSSQIRQQYTGASNGFQIGQFNSSGDASINNQANANLLLATNNTERMRIDSSGNVLVGTTDTTPYNNTSGGGFVVASSGLTSIARETTAANQAILHLNNTGVDGIIAEFAKDGTAVGSIGVISSRPYISTDYGSDSGLRFDSAFIAPCTTTGSGRDNAIDLGDTGNRFKALYLSGDIVLGAADGYIFGNTNGVNIRASSGKSTIFDTAGSERMRIDSSGNVLVGTTDALPATNNDIHGIALRADGNLMTSRSGSVTARFNRGSSDGDIVAFHKDGTTVGSIGSYLGNYLYIGSTGGVDTHLGFVNGTVRPATSAGGLLDNALDLGISSARFDDIFATNGTIQTSDRNEKQDIEALSEAEQRVAVAAKGLLRKFRWIDSVEEKGDDARIHFGIIAQDLQAAFEAEGLDAGRYAMFINSTWTDEETGEERSRMGVRYNQLLAFIIAAI